MYSDSECYRYVGHQHDGEESGTIYGAPVIGRALDRGIGCFFVDLKRGVICTIVRLKLPGKSLDEYLATTGN